MKQVNLKKKNITEIDFMFWTTLKDDILEKIQSVVSPDEEDDYMFGDSYKVDNVGHIATALVSKSKGEGRYRIRCRCEIGRGGRLGKDVISVGKLFEILSSIEEKVTVLSMIKLSFGRRQKYKTIISLPMKVTYMPNMPYDEIHGFHFVKREGKTFKYEVILDLEENGTLIETIICPKLRNIKKSIIEEIIEQGIEISDDFILVEKR